MNVNDDIAEMYIPVNRVWFPQISLMNRLDLCDAFEFSRNYTKLAMLSFLYCFVVKGKLI